MYVYFFIVKVFTFQRRLYIKTGILAYESSTYRPPPQKVKHEILGIIELVKTYPVVISGKVIKVMTITFKERQAWQRVCLFFLLFKSRFIKFFNGSFLFSLSA